CAIIGCTASAKPTASLFTRKSRRCSGSISGSRLFFKFSIIETPSVATCAVCFFSAAAVERCGSDDRVEDIWRYCIGLPPVLSIFWTHLSAIMHAMQLRQSVKIIMLGYALCLALAVAIAAWWIAAKPDVSIPFWAPLLVPVAAAFLVGIRHIRR